MAQIAIRAEHLSKVYRTGVSGARYGRLTESIWEALRKPFKGDNPKGPDDRELKALDDVSLEISEGDLVGIIGRNGAGKSTLLKVLSRITEPTAGYAELRGRVGSLLEVGTGFHPELTGAENVYLNGAILGMRGSEIRSKFDDIVGFAEVERFVDTPVKRYSSGMQVRLAFAVAAHLEPEILLVDEVLAVGDVSFQRKCLGKMGEVASEGRTILFVSHNMAAVSNLCRTGYFLDRGAVRASGEIGPVISEYLDLVHDRGVEDLKDRRDRKGDGRLRFTEVSLRGELQASLVCGAPGGFELYYEAASVLRNVHISVGIFTTMGEGAAYLSNDLVGEWFDEIPASGRMVCELAHVPFLPGTYALTLYCTVSGVVADWIEDAARVDVAEGDFFGSGKLPPTGYGSVAVDHRWHIAHSRG